MVQNDWLAQLHEASTKCVGLPALTCGSFLQDYFGDAYYNAEPVDFYLGGLYWSAMTMSTIGYGDIVPTNSMEMAFSTFSMVCGAFAYG